MSRVGHKAICTDAGSARNEHPLHAGQAPDAREAHCAQGLCGEPLERWGSPFETLPSGGTCGGGQAGKGRRVQVGRRPCRPRGSRYFYTRFSLRPVTAISRALRTRKRQTRVSTGMCALAPGVMRSQDTVAHLWRVYCAPTRNLQRSSRCIMGQKQQASGSARSTAPISESHTHTPRRAWKEVG